MPRQERGGLVVARTSFYSGKLLVRSGEVWAADDPVVAGYPQAFGRVNVRRSTPVVEEPEPTPRARGREAVPA